jgi:hypothetical protein
MGIMLLVLAPIPYVDATAAGVFRSKWRRATVGAAGMLVELFLAAIAMFVWVLAEPGLVRSIAFNVLLVAGASTLLFNGNPLLRYDGYYVLADLIEIPNLGNRSNKYWQWLAKRYLFGLKNVERPQASAGERRWFIFYGAASFLYRTFVMILITLFIASEFFFVGVVLAIWAATTMFVLPIGKGLAYVLTSPELQRARTRARLVTFGGLGVFLLFVLAVPLPLRTHAEGVVWVPENAEVRAAADGFVERLLVAPEASVSAGDLLLASVEPTLSAEVEESRARVRQFEVQYTSLMFEERTQAAAIDEDLRRERVVLARAEEKLDSLLVIAQVPGVLKLARAQDLPGRHVKKGELLGYLVSGPPRLLRVVVTQDDIALVRDRRTAVEVKITDRLEETWSARVLREVPGGHDQLAEQGAGARRRRPARHRSARPERTEIAAKTVPVRSRTASRGRSRCTSARGLSCASTTPPSRSPRSGDVACASFSCRASMSRALLDSWRVKEFAPGLYPERRDLKDGRLDRFVGGLLGRWAQRGSPWRARRLRQFAERVEACADELTGLDAAQLGQRVASVRQALALQGLADAAVSECFALVREVCARELGLRHYPVQLMGGYAMLCGTLAEMQTGEGKTLTAVLPAVTVALAGAPVHVITVNAYLARRDAEHLGPVYAFFGLRVGLIVPELASAERAAAYGCDVTYCVNKDVTFDYLRDRITQKRGEGWCLRRAR